MVGPDSDGIPRAPPYSGVCQRRTFPFAYGTFTPCGLLSQHSSARKCLCNSARYLQIPARKTHNTPYTTTAALHASGLGCTPFAHHYSGHLFRFLFLRLLRCFTSPGCPRNIRLQNFFCKVSPFGYPRIYRHLLLPVAFRSLLRPSSASGA